MARFEISAVMVGDDARAKNHAKINDCILNGTVLIICYSGLDPRGRSRSFVNCPKPRENGCRGPLLCEAPDISVVIATCNRPHTLVQAIRSALNQACAEVEVIVVDDSADHTAAGVMQKLGDPRVRYVVSTHPSNGRPALARNYGVSLARGPLVHFLDDDDLVPAGYYAAALAAFAEQPGFGVVFGTIEPFGEDPAEIARQRQYFAQARRRALLCARLGHRWAFTAAMLFGPTLLVCSAVMVRREQVAAIGGFDASLPLVEDVDFYLRAIRQGGVRFLDRPALRYRVGPSLMRQANRDQMILESYQRLQTHYRNQRGGVEFLTLKCLARGIGLS